MNVRLSNGMNSLASRRTLLTFKMRKKIIQNCPIIVLLLKITEGSRKQLWCHLVVVDNWGPLSQTIRIGFHAFFKRFFKNSNRTLKPFQSIKFRYNINDHNYPRSNRSFTDLESISGLIIYRAWRNFSIDNLYCIGLTCIMRFWLVQHLIQLPGTARTFNIIFSHEVLTSSSILSQWKHITHCHW